MIDGAVTGFTYVGIVPVVKHRFRNDEAERAACIAAGGRYRGGIVNSVLFSLRLHNPLRRIMEMMERNSAQTLPTSSIREYTIRISLKMRLWLYYL